jgi:hypothetical protein
MIQPSLMFLGKARTWMTLVDLTHKHKQHCAGDKRSSLFVGYKEKMFCKICP